MGFLLPLAMISLCFGLDMYHDACIVLQIWAELNPVDLVYSRPALGSIFLCPSQPGAMADIVI